MNIIELAKQANRYASHQTNDSQDWQLIRDEHLAQLVRQQVLEEVVEVCDLEPSLPITIIICKLKKNCEYHRNST
jgi:hypothetical protein